MAQSAEGADVRELAGAAYVYLSRFVDPEAALVDGFDVLAWCDGFDRLRTIGALEGGEAGAARAVPHGASPSSSGPRKRRSVEAALPSTPLEMAVAERDALRQDLRDAQAQIVALGERVWELESQRFEFSGKQIPLSAEGMT